jgi:hypothetical protein
MTGMFFHRLRFRIRGDDPIDGGGVLLPERACQLGEISGGNP